MTYRLYNIYNRETLIMAYSGLGRIQLTHNLKLVLEDGQIGSLKVLRGGIRSKGGSINKNLKAGIYQE